MSKEELNQFVQKFDKAPKGPVAPGREIEVKPGKTEALDPNRRVSDLNSSTKLNTRTVQNRGVVPDDNLRGNQEGAKFEAPDALKARFEAYKKGTARQRSTRAAPRPARRGRKMTSTPGRSTPGRSGIGRITLCSHRRTCLDVTSSASTRRISRTTSPTSS